MLGFDCFVDKRLSKDKVPCGDGFGGMDGAGTRLRPGRCQAVAGFTLAGRNSCSVAVVGGLKSLSCNSRERFGPGRSSPGRPRGVGADRPGMCCVSGNGSRDPQIPQVDAEVGVAEERGPQVICVDLRHLRIGSAS